MARFYDTINERNCKTLSKRIFLMPHCGINSLGTITAEICYDDAYNNGHKTLSITGEVKEGRDVVMCGCIHDTLLAEFPELERIIPWHLCSQDGPLHYIENAMYWAGHRGYCDGRPGSPPDIKNFASTIIYPHVPGDLDVTMGEIAMDEQALKAWLEYRLLPLLDEFSTVLREFGFEP